MVVVAILSVVSISVSAFMLNGSRLWQKITTELVREKVFAMWDRMSGDLANAFVFEGIDFHGDSYEMSFPGLVSFNGNETVGKIEYVLNDSRKILRRREYDYAHLSADEPLREKTVLRNVEAFYLEYYQYDENQDSYGWVTYWPPEAVSVISKEEKEPPPLPLAVRVEVKVETQDGTKTFVKVFPVPSGCCWREQEERKRP